MQKETTNAHQWTRSSADRSYGGHQNSRSMFGEPWRGRRGAKELPPLFVVIRVPSWLN